MHDLEILNLNSDSILCSFINALKIQNISIFIRYQHLADSIFLFIYRLLSVIDKLI